MRQSCSVRHAQLHAASLSRDKVARQNDAIKLHVWHRSNSCTGCSRVSMRLWQDCRVYIFEGSLTETFTRGILGALVLRCKYSRPKTSVPRPFRTFSSERRNSAACPSNWTLPIRAMTLRLWPRPLRVAKWTHKSRSCMFSVVIHLRREMPTFTWRKQRAASAGTNPGFADGDAYESEL